MVIQDRLKTNPELAKEWLKYDPETQDHLINIFVHEIDNAYVMLKMNDLRYYEDAIRDQVEESITSFFIPNEHYECVVILEKYMERLEQVSNR